MARAGSPSLPGSGSNPVFRDKVETAKKGGVCGLATAKPSAHVEGPRVAPALHGGSPGGRGAGACSQLSIDRFPSSQEASVRTARSRRGWGGKPRGRWGPSPGKTLLELPLQTQPCVPTYQWNFPYILIYNMPRNHMKPQSELQQCAGLGEVGGRSPAAGMDFPGLGKWGAQHGHMLMTPQGH